MTVVCPAVNIAASAFNYFETFQRFLQNDNQDLKK